MFYILLHCIIILLYYFKNCIHFNRASSKLACVCLQCEGWINEASQFLLTIGRKATDCKRSEDAVGLISQLNQFKEDGAMKQNGRLNNMERVATNLYGN